MTANEKGSNSNQIFSNTNSQLGDPFGSKFYVHMLSHVEITKPAQLACTAHALTTQTEEVMGLLVGLWVECSSNYSRVYCQTTK